MAGTTTRPVKSAQTAAANYGTNGSAANAANLWAQDFLADPQAIFAAAAARVSYWQSQVSTQQAATNYVNGLNDVNIQALTTKVNGVGKASFSAGVKAAGAPGGKYAAFAAEFQPWLTNELATLNRTNPRGDATQNRARLNAFLDALEAQKGNFRQ